MLNNSGGKEEEEKAGERESIGLNRSEQLVFDIGLVLDENKTFQVFFESRATFVIFAMCQQSLTTIKRNKKSLFSQFIKATTKMGYTLP